MADIFKVVGRIAYEGADQVARQLNNLDKAADQVEQVLDVMGNTAASSSRVLDRMADTGEQGMKQLDTAAEGAGQAVDDLQNAGQAAAQGVQRLEAGLTGATDAALDVSRAADGAATAANGLQGEFKQVEGAADRAGQSIDDTAHQMEGLGNSAQGSGAEATGAASKWQKFGQSLDKLGSKAKELGGKFKESAAQIGKSLDTIGTKTKDIGSNMRDKLTVPLVAFGTAAGFAANDMDVAAGRIAARLGTTGAETEKLTEKARTLWKQGFGDSMSGVADDITLVSQNMQGLGAEGAGALEKAAKSAYTLERAFGADIQESTRTASTLMNNFGDSSEHAFDIIARGFQKGGNYSGDLLETLNEFAPQFADMGFSSEKFLNTLIKGTQAGAFSVDKVGDAVKEFNVRAWDGSKTTAEGFAAIGLNATEMGAAVAEGGDSAQRAFLATLAGLSAITDEQARNKAGTDLFGTQWEDLSGKVVTAMADTTNALGTVEGATDKAGASLRDNFGERLKQMWRGAQDDLIPLGNTVLDLAETYLPPLMSGVNKLASWFAKLSPSVQSAMVVFMAIMAAIGPLVVVLGVVIGAVGNIITVFTKLGPVIGFVKNAFTAVRGAMLLLSGPVGWIILAITSLIAIGIAIYKNWSTLGPMLSGIWEAVKTAVLSIVSSIGSGLAAAWAGIVSAFQAVGSALGTAGSAIAGVFVSIWEGIKTGASAAFEFIGNVVQTGIMLLASIIQLGVTILLLPWRFLWENFKGVLIPIFTSIGTFLSTTFNTIKTVVLTIWNGTINAIVLVASTVVGFVVGHFNRLVAGLSIIWSAIKSTTQAAWSVLVSLISGPAKRAAALAISTFNSLKSRVTAIFNGVKSVAGSVWRAVTTVISTAVTGAKNKAVSIFNSLKSSLSSIFNSIRSTAASVFGRVKSAIMTPINAAVSGVKTAVGKIKGFFSGLKLKLPNIKLPHFSMSGDFSIKPPSVPKIGVKWYDKGGIFDGPQVIGVGEKRPEFVGALDDLRGIVTAAMGDYRGPMPAAASGGDTFVFNIDPRNIKEFNDLVSMAQDFRQTVRRG